MAQQSASGGGMFRWLNILMRFMLRSPLHGMLSKNLMLITFTGRKSGRQYTTPVSYVQEGSEVTLLTHANWWKNLRGGAPVTLRLRGREVRGVAQPCPDGQIVADGLAWFLKRLPRDARFYGVKLDASGSPDPGDCRRGAEGTVLIKVRLDGFVTGFMEETA